MTPELASICAELEIVVVHPAQHRPHTPMHTAAGQTMEDILRHHGDGHLRAVLGAIVETTNNRHMLVAPVIKAVSDIMLAHPTWLSEAFLEALDDIDLAALYDRARASKLTGGKRHAVAAWLYDELRDKLEPEKQNRLI